MDSLSNKKPNNSDWVTLPGDRALIQASKRAVQQTQDQTHNALFYQNYLLDESFKFISKFNLAIDAGANYGIFSYHLNYKFNKVLAFEVDTKVRDCLKENVKKFSLTNVDVMDFGLGEMEKFVNLSYLKNSFGTYIDPSDTAGSYLVKTIDSLMLEYCDFIKIDCEGYESQILQGAEETIKKYKPVILMEDKNLGRRYGLDVRENVEILQRWSYQIAFQWPKDVLMIA